MPIYHRRWNYATNLNQAAPHPSNILPKHQDTSHICGHQRILVARAEGSYHWLPFLARPLVDLPVWSSEVHSLSFVDQPSQLPRLQEFVRPKTSMPSPVFSCHSCKLSHSRPVLDLSTLSSCRLLHPVVTSTCSRHLYRLLITIHQFWWMQFRIWPFNHVRLRGLKLRTHLSGRAGSKEALVIHVLMFR